MNFQINGCNIGPNEPPYVVAEISANHNGQLANALRLIEEAKSAGAHAVKLQTYTPDTITLNCDSADFRITGGLWDGRTLYELYQEAHTPWAWHAPLFEYARKVGITIFSSPFDNTAVDFLEDLNSPAYKIASFEAVDIQLIKYVAATQKPMIISTGMASEEEIEEAINAAREGGCSQLAILHCVSGYPAPASDYNLRIIPDMVKKFSVPVGLSDHTMDNASAIAAVALGACIIEKHFTLNRKGGGPDDSFSLEPSDFKRLCHDAGIAWSALGSATYERSPSELKNMLFRRSLYFVKDLKAGEIITGDAVRSVRPGNGLPPRFLGMVVGSILREDVIANTPVTTDSISRRSHE